MATSWLRQRAEEAVDALAEEGHFSKGEKEALAEMASAVAREFAELVLTNNGKSKEFASFLIAEADKDDNE